MNKRLGRLIISLFLTVLAGGRSFAAEQPSHVQIQKDSGKWKLLVDGQPFFVKGIGCNEAVGSKGEDYLRMAKEMGANAVRTWGHAPRSYLDQVQAYGLKVDLGFWLNPIRGKTTESYRDPSFRHQMKEKLMTYVRSMKDHPALITWNVGNEVLAFTKDPDERVAFAKFLDELIVAVHQEDPNHPIVYACSANRDLPELEKYTPHLDIVGMNIYGPMVPQLSPGYDKPVLVTEFGPPGAWDSGKDANRLPFEPSDSMKASSYLAIWRHIEADKDRCLGGFAFYLGEQRNQGSLTWWNINYGENKRPAYWTLYTAYTGNKPPHALPRIQNFELDKTSAGPKKQITVGVDAVSPENSSLSYDYFITTILNDPVLLEPIVFMPTHVEKLGPGKASLQAPDLTGDYRVYAVISDSNHNAVVSEHSLRVVSR